MAADRLRSVVCLFVDAAKFKSGVFDSNIKIKKLQTVKSIYL